LQAKKKKLAKEEAAAAPVAKKMTARKAASSLPSGRVGRCLVWTRELLSVGQSIDFDQSSNEDIITN